MLKSEVYECVCACCPQYRPSHAPLLGSVELVCDIWEHETTRGGGGGGGRGGGGSYGVRYQCALLLRNCCFNPSAKPLLANNGTDVDRYEQHF